MVVEVFADLANVTKTGGADAPAPGTSETWADVTGCTLPACSTAGSPATHCYVRDLDAETELIEVTACSGSGAGSITVTRGAGSSSPVAHAAGARFYQVVSAAGLGSFIQAPAGPPVVALTDAPTISVDASTGNRFSLTLTGSHTLGNPVNPVQDMQQMLIVVNPGTFTLSYGSAYNWGPAGAPALTASKDNYLGFIYNAAASQWRGIAYAAGY